MIVRVENRFYSKRRNRRSNVCLGTITKLSTACGEKAGNMYSYSPLQGHRHIRLLRLLPDWNQNGPLRSQLFEYPMLEMGDGPHMFEALSYVWGSPEKPHTLHVDEQPMPITANLYEVLMRLRDRMIERIVWIDAVCIDQTNMEERGEQIQYMAEIYSKANRVIVWLGEAANESDRALKQIRMAADEEQQKSSLTDEDRQAVLAILDRPWFRRIWVLQEVAAAQHIVMMCGSIRLDGYAFCLGLPSLLPYEHIPSHIRSVTYLMRGSIFRPKYSINSSGGISLDIRPLGGLIDMYHAHEATERHDKIFALLGMSSDNPGAFGLAPNYRMPWNKLMANLVKFILGERVLVWSWIHQQAAVVFAKGYVVGIVSSVRMAKDDSRGDRQHVRLKIQDTLGPSWTVPVAVKPIEVGDIFCHLLGATNPMVVRPCGDYFSIIMVQVAPPSNAEIDMMDLKQLEQSSSSSMHDFLLIWDWDILHDETQHRDYEAWMTSRLPQHKQAEPEGYLDKRTRLWNSALIMSDAGSNGESVVITLEEMKQFCIPDSGQVDRRALMCMSKLALSYGRAGRSWEAEVEFWRVFWTMKRTRQASGDIIRELVGFGAMCKSHGHIIKARNLEKIAGLLEMARRYPIMEDDDFAVILADASVREVEISERLVMKAGGKFQSATHADEPPSRRRHAAPLEVLLARAVRKGNVEATYLVLSHKKTQVNEEVLINAVRSEDSSALWCILGREEDEIQIGEDIVIAAAKKSNESVLQYLLERHEDKVHITEEVVVAAADNQERSVLVYLLGKWKHRFHITERVAIAAAENEEFPALKILLQEKGGEIEPTMQVVMAAASNREKSVLHNLVLEKGSEIGMTEEEIVAAWKKKNILAVRHLNDIPGERFYRNIHLRRQFGMQREDQERI
ncbi:HET domain-containing protein [Trichoderma novae-zelandiae]